MLCLALVLAVRQSWAGGDDVAVLSTVQQVMTEDYTSAAFGPATEKLRAALERCKHGQCTGATRAQVYIAMGMVASQLGHADEAKTDFSSAVAADPRAKLPSSGTTPSIRSQWAAANGPDAAPPPSDLVASPPPAAAKPTHVPGWNSVDAFQFASAGLKADLAHDLPGCIKNDKASLELEEQPRTRLHLASCERRSGKLIDALRDTEKALQDGIKKRDRPVMRAARKRVTDLLHRIPHVTFVPPAGVSDLSVTFDDRPVPPASLTKRFSIDPGKHAVHAEGTQGGIPLSFDKEYDVEEGELVTVHITLKARTSEYLTPGQLKCMLAAKSQEEVVKCLPQGRKNLAVKAGMEFSAYSDTNAVNVVTPAINASVSSPTAGWNVGATYLLDVVTAASPDIVSEASPVFRDRRHAATLTGGYKHGIFAGQANAGLSIENDYTSISGGLALTADLRDKLLTPRIAYNYSHDTIGRTNTPLDVFSHQLDTHDFDVGLTMVLSPTTILLVSGTLQLERGDQSKPYRYIPMFDPATARRIPVGATVDLVNRVRLPLRPLEQLPTSLDRYAVGVRLAHRFHDTATLRIDQRLYVDSWSILSTTTDGRWVQDIGKRLSAWPHLRLNAQTGASFYQLAYAATLNQDGSVTVPLFRSDDRELGPLITLTGGGGARFAITPPDARMQVGITAQADVMFTRFFDALFVTARTAVYGTLGIDVEYE